MSGIGDACAYQRGQPILYKHGPSGQMVPTFVLDLSSDGLAPDHSLSGGVIPFWTCHRTCPQITTDEVARALATGSFRGDALHPGVLRAWRAWCSGTVGMDVTQELARTRGYTPRACCTTTMGGHTIQYWKDEPLLYRQAGSKLHVPTLVLGSFREGIIVLHSSR